MFNEAQICPKIKNKLRTIETQLQMQMWLKVLTEKHNTSRHYMWRFIADLSAVINTEWAEKKNQNCAVQC